MKKQIKKTLNHGCICSDLEGTIEEAIAFLVKLKEENAEQVFLEEDWDYSDKRLIAYTNREETDTEYEHRIKREKQFEEQRIARIKQEAIKLGLIKA